MISLQEGRRSQHIPSVKKKIKSRGKSNFGTWKPPTRREKKQIHPGIRFLQYLTSCICIWLELRWQMRFYLVLYLYPNFHLNTNTSAAVLFAFCSLFGFCWFSNGKAAFSILSDCDNFKIVHFCCLFKMFTLLWRFHESVLLLWCCGKKWNCWSLHPFIFATMWKVGIADPPLPRACIHMIMDETFKSLSTKFTSFQQRDFFQLWHA